MKNKTAMFQVGTVLDIRRGSMFPSKSVVVTDIEMLIDGDTIRAIVTILHDDGGTTTVGAFQLAQWIFSSEAAG